MRRVKNSGGHESWVWLEPLWHWPPLALSLMACTHRADREPAACTRPPTPGPADTLAKELRNLPPYLDSGVVISACPEPPRSCPPPPASPSVLKRERIYRQLFALGNASILALAQALTCSDRNLRLNAELAQGELAGPAWERNDHYRSKMDISAALPALMYALNDPDPRIRAYAEDDINAVDRMPPKPPRSASICWPTVTSQSARSHTSRWAISN